MNKKIIIEGLELSIKNLNAALECCKTENYKDAEKFVQNAVDGNWLSKRALLLVSYGSNDIDWINEAQINLLKKFTNTLL